MNQDLTYRQRQELKAFSKSGKKRYFVSSSTKVLTPWLRTLHTEFSLTDLGLATGDRVLVSLEFGTNVLEFTGQSRTGVSSYRHNRLTYEFNDSCLIGEFDSVPNHIFFTVESSNTYKGEACNCGK